MISHNDNLTKGGGCDINVNRYVICYFFILKTNCRYQ